MTRDTLAAEIHALYLSTAKLYGWKVMEGPLQTMPKDLQAMQYALADFMLGQIEAVKQEAMTRSIADNPELIAAVLESLAEVLRSEAKTVPVVGSGLAGVKPPQPEKTRQAAPGFEV